MRTRRLFIGLSAAASARAIDTREPAPRFSGKTIDGEMFDNDSLKGQVVLFQFWTTWCGYCRRDQDAVDSIVEQYKSKNVTVIAVNVGETRKKVKAYLADNARTCKIVLTSDTNLAAIFGARGYPLYVVLDRKGKLAGRQEGAGGERALEALLERALEP